MRQPQSRRSPRKTFSVVRERGVLFFIAFAVVALVCLQVSTGSVASRGIERAASGAERMNVRIPNKQRPPKAANNSAPLAAPLAVVDVDRSDDTAAASACTPAANDCSLRGAIAFANSNPGTTISLPAGTYSLSIPGGLVEGFNGDNAIGDLDIRADNTSIIGAGAASTVINQTAANDRVIEVNPFLDAGFDTTISGVTISGGKEGTAVGGGGIIAGSINNSLMLTDCVFTGNSATGAGTFGGGGVAHTGGNLTVTNCTFTNNSTSGSGGAISYTAGDPLVRQPSLGTLAVTGSSFSGNTSQSVAAGGGALDLYNYNLGSSTYNVSTSSFVNNIASNGRGGAIVVESGPLTIQYSRLVGNAASLPANGKTIYAGGSANANDNWWGANSGPASDDITGPAETPTLSWLVLRHAANPTSICSGGTATLNADIKGRNAGMALTTELNGLPTFPAQFINATPALGTVSGGTAFVNGAASAMFTAGASFGTAMVDVMADSQTETASIAIDSNSTTDPGDQEVCEGGTASFTTTTSGSGPVSYVWKQGASPISSGGRFTIISTSDSSTLTITSVQPGDAATYTVEATGACNTATQSATLTVNTAPSITQNPASQTVTPGNSVTFTAAASGSPTPTVQWQVSVMNGPFTDISGATSTTLTFIVQASDDGNRYRAVFTNSCGGATTQAATLSTCTAPSVTGSPASVADACVGSIVNFNASATGNPAPTVQWQRSLDGGGSWSNISGATSTTLSVTVTAALNNSQYRAVFTNDCGTDTSAPATLGVDSIAPVITLTGNTITLSPPNHNYHTINVGDIVASVSDNCSLDGGVVITSVSSDETENGNGDGNTNNDIIIANDCKSVQLRAERQTSGNGRVYRINLELKDSAGNVATAMVKVYVPKSQNGAAAVDDGPAAGYTVNSNCP